MPFGHPLGHYININFGLSYLKNINSRNTKSTRFIRSKVTTRVFLDSNNKIKK